MLRSAGEGWLRAPAPEAWRCRQCGGAIRRGVFKKARAAICSYLDGRLDSHPARNPYPYAAGTLCPDCGTAENDPTAAARREKIEEWNREADPQWEKYQPLRWALCRQVLDGSMDGWEKLQSHPIFGIRAKFHL